MHTYHIRVGASHTGSDALMTLPAMVDVMQDCSQFWLDGEPFIDAHLRKHGQALFVTYRQTDVLRRPRFRERLRVATSIYDANTFFGYRNTAIYDEDEQPCALSWCLGSFVSLSKRRVERLPKAVLDSLTIDPPLPMEYLGRKIALPEAEFTPAAAFVVPPSYIDLNGHMNNARYFELAYNLFPGCEITRARAEYRAQAVMGDILIPHIAEADGNAYVLLSNGSGKIISIVEFWLKQ